MTRSFPLHVLALHVLVGAGAACSSFASTEVPVDASASDAANGDAAATDPGADADTDPADATVRDAAGDGGPRRLVAFVTLVGYADVTTTASADTKCKAEAAGRLTGSFVAWFSSASEPAPSRLVDSKGAPVDGPWYRLDGARIVANRAALSNTANVPLEHPININAAKMTASPSVWTGTLANGTTGNVCPMAQPTSGTASETGPAWTEQTFFSATCGSSLGLYCFQVE